MNVLHRSAVCPDGRKSGSILHSAEVYHPVPADARGAATHRRAHPQTRERHLDQTGEEGDFLKATPAHRCLTPEMRCSLKVFILLSFTFLFEGDFVFFLLFMAYVTMKVKNMICTSEHKLG